MYSSLHNHDYYSLLDGYGSPKEMLDRAKELGLKAYATTNHGNAYSFIYYDLLKKEYPDIKLIFGTELYECNDITVKDKDNKYFHLICLVRNEQGRKDLNKVITKSNFEGFYFKPRCTIEDLKPYAENFVISSACLASKIAREEDFNKCVEYINEYKEAFPYFYLEMQSHQHQDQCLYNQKILELSKITNTPFIITTDSHAPKKEDLYYQDKLIQIGRKSTNNDKNAIENSEVYEGCYMQSEEEIHECMDSQIGYENVCIGLDNTNKVSDLIGNVNMPFQSPQLPTFPLPDGFNDNNEFLWHLIKEGWKDRGYDKLSEEEQQIRRDRLNYEMKIIHEMGFDGYFLFVWDFINAAQKLGVEVGRGRGSAAGSLVCYCCHITDIDPIKYGLIFERFLNPERVGLPDIDTDVGDRDAIIKYLVDKYGEDRVCQIINYSYITPTVAITDVGKILGFPYNQMQKLSQKFTFDKWDDCIKVNPTLINDNPQYADLFDIASHLSGRVKTVSIHAGGVGIVDTSINDYMPMKIGTKGEHVIQVDKHYIEDIGIIKFDLLGVATLNIIKEIKDDLHLDPWDYDINNPKFENDRPTYELLASGKTNGVFQVESAGMKDLLIRLKPKLEQLDFEVISVILALYRPDSMGALDEYVEMAIGGSRPPSIHPDMDEILKDTNYCMIYQEQLLDIVKKFGGRTYGGADLFRKAIGKKLPELVKKQSEILRNEIVANGYSKDIADKIADELSQKGGLTDNINKSCYKVKSYNQLTSDDKNKIINFYYKNKNILIKDIGNIIGISNRAVHRVLKEANINTRLKNRYNIKNQNYFENIDSEFKSYILGFIYADGFVGTHNDFCIALSDKVPDNLKILNRFQNELGIDNLIYHSINKNGDGYFTLKFSNKQLVSDLNKHGVFTRKSLTMENLPDIDDDLMNHFIRGYFDGDGTICTWFDKFDNRTRYCMEILGTEIFLNKIQKIICSNCNIKATKLHDVKRVDGLTRISHRGIKNLIKIREYLYKDASIFLTYKHDRFYNIQPL